MNETIDAELLCDQADSSRREGITGPSIGIIGGGQLARMTALSALQLGCDVIVLEKNRFSPAATLATHSLVGDWNTLEPLLKLASLTDVITLENEFVDASLLLELERLGHTVVPSARTMGLVQDKFIQKQTLEAVGIPVPRMRAINTLAELQNAAHEFGFPFLLKARRNAYDGKGNCTVRSAENMETAWSQLGGNAGNPLYVEAFCNFAKELAVIITRDHEGEAAVYPVVETVQRNHVCNIVRAPASVSLEAEASAADIARRAVDAVGAVGTFGVEMFMMHGGEILVNELAPRVHNSGHYTIEACTCSQFENHVRAVLGLPLGSTAMTSPAAVMVNLLGTHLAPGRPQGLQRALGTANAHVHLYGKAMSGPGRKMGHVTALGASTAEAEEIALKCADEISFGDNT